MSSPLARDLARLTLALLVWTALAAALLLGAPPVPEAALWATQVEPPVSTADYLQAVDQARGGWLRYGLELAWITAALPALAWLLARAPRRRRPALRGPRPWLVTTGLGLLVAALVLGLNVGGETVTDWMAPRWIAIRVGGLGLPLAESVAFAVGDGGDLFLMAAFLPYVLGMGFLTLATAGAWREGSAAADHERWLRRVRRGAPDGGRA